jgi:hypothetical protein
MLGQNTVDLAAEMDLPRANTMPVPHVIHYLHQKQAFFSSLLEMTTVDVTLGRAFACGGAISGAAWCYPPSS